MMDILTGPLISTTYEQNDVVQEFLHDSMQLNTQELIRVNAILPGIVEGPRMEKVIRDRADAAGVSHTAMRDDYLKNISMRRMVTPDDVAATVAFLISDAGANLSGQSLAVDGNVETL